MSSRRYVISNVSTIIMFFVENIASCAGHADWGFAMTTPDITMMTPDVAMTTSAVVKTTTDDSRTTPDIPLTTPDVAMTTSNIAMTTPDVRWRSLTLRGRHLMLRWRHLFTYWMSVGWRPMPYEAVTSLFAVLHEGISSNDEQQEWIKLFLKNMLANPTWKSSWKASPSTVFHV